MRMRQTLEKIFRCCGTELTLVRGEESWTVRAFFQPNTSRARQNMVSAITPVGTVGPGQYVYLGPAEPALQVGDTLIAGGTAYLLRRRETLYEKDGPLYQWGLCTKKGGADTWPALS